MEEVEDLVEVADRLLVTTADNKDTTCEIVPTLPLLVSITSCMFMLLKNVLFYKLRCRKIDHKWEIKMSS